MTRLLMTNLLALYDIMPTWHAEAVYWKWGEGHRWMGGCGNKLQKYFSVSRCNHMNYCTRAYSKQSICYLLERSQHQQNSSQKKESESVQNKESTVRKIQENTRPDTAEEDKLSGRFLLQGLTAWELTGPACSRAYESINTWWRQCYPSSARRALLTLSSHVWTAITSIYKLPVLSQ